MEQKACFNYGNIFYQQYHRIKAYKKNPLFLPGWNMCHCVTIVVVWTAYATALQLSHALKANPFLCVKIN
jgi:hypothetical protein